MGMRVFFIVSMGLAVLNAGSALAQPITSLTRTLPLSGCVGANCGAAAQGNASLKFSLAEIGSPLRADAILQDFDRDPGYLVPNSKMDEQDKELVARRMARKMIGKQLDKLMKDSPLAATYKQLGEVVKESKELLTFAGPGLEDPDSDTLKSPSYSKKKSVTFGVDPLRGFTPMLSIGEHSRVIADPIRQQYLLEVGYTF